MTCFGDVEAMACASDAPEQIRIDQRNDSADARYAHPDRDVFGSIRREQRNDLASLR
jgi:hypothetical protein